MKKASVLCYHLLQAYSQAKYIIINAYIDIIIIIIILLLLLFFLLLLLLLLY